MIYELVLKEDSPVPYDFELRHDNPHSVSEVFSAIREQFEDEIIVILRDEIEIAPGQLASDVESYELQMVIEKETKLPSTYRHGRGGDSDLAVGADGEQHGVWKPKNPEGDFS